MKKLSILTLALSLTVTHACCSHEEAIKTAIEGPEGAHATVAKHRFAVQPPEMKKNGKSSHILTGQLTRLGTKASKDDVIAYRVTREKGAVKSIEVQINDGMWLPVSGSVMDALGDYCKGVPMPEEKQQEATRALEKLMDGSWQKAAEFLIAHIAARHC
jgi:hypothetical protein